MSQQMPIQNSGMSNFIVSHHRGQSIEAKRAMADSKLYEEDEARLLTAGDIVHK
jgi:hypothetical protein